MVGNSEFMNEENQSKCYSGDGYMDWDKYKIPLDSKGNNFVTGEG
jgi:hypothetical protein